MEQSPTCSSIIRSKTSIEGICSFLSHKPPTRFPCLCHRITLPNWMAIPDAGGISYFQLCVFALTEHGAKFMIICMQTKDQIPGEGETNHHPRVIIIRLSNGTSSSEIPSLTMYTFLPSRHRSWFVYLCISIEASSYSLAGCLINRQPVEAALTLTMIFYSRLGCLTKKKAFRYFQVAADAASKRYGGGVKFS